LGTIPKDAILETVAARGLADSVGSIRVQHVSGGVSLIVLKSYLAGREAFQGESLSWAWADEEPDFPVYTELLTRTNVGSPLSLLQLRRCHLQIARAAAMFDRMRTDKLKSLQGTFGLVGGIQIVPSQRRQGGQGR
jgi:phage terminase large subunit-like protein